MNKILISILVIFTSQASATIPAIILIADPKILAVPIKENNESLIDFKDQKSICFGPSPEIPNNIDYTKLRKTVYDKLMYAQSLLPKGLKLCVYEGYRSLSLQNKLFEGRYKKVKYAHPKWSHEQIFKETIKLVSPIINLDDSPNIPPHSTGAAVDVYLVNTDKRIIDMGIHPKDWMNDHDGSLSQTDSQKISPEAQKNRKIMSDALSKAGFVNYPTEYWHWSYGDRYWAYQLKKDHAIYGSIE